MVQDCARKLYFQFRENSFNLLEFRLLHNVNHLIDPEYFECSMSTKFTRFETVFVGYVRFA